MRDGVYQVRTSGFVAGFVVKDGEVIRCAPILRRNLNRWRKEAVRICGLPEDDE